MNNKFKLKCGDVEVEDLRVFNVSGVYGDDRRMIKALEPYADYAEVEREIESLSSHANDGSRYSNG